MFNVVDEAVEECLSYVPTMMFKPWVFHVGHSSPHIACRVEWDPFLGARACFSLEFLAVGCVCRVSEGFP